MTNTDITHLNPNVSGSTKRGYQKKKKKKAQHDPRIVLNRLEYLVGQPGQ